MSGPACLCALQLLQVPFWRNFPTAIVGRKWAQLGGDRDCPVNFSLCSCINHLDRYIKFKLEKWSCVSIQDGLCSVDAWGLSSFLRLDGLAQAVGGIHDAAYEENVAQLVVVDGKHKGTFSNERDWSWPAIIFIIFVFFIKFD